MVLTIYMLAAEILFTAQTVSHPEGFSRALRGGNNPRPMNILLQNNHVTSLALHFPPAREHLALHCPAI